MPFVIFAKSHAERLGSGNYSDGSARYTGWIDTADTRDGAQAVLDAFLASPYTPTFPYYAIDENLAETREKALPREASAYGIIYVDTASDRENWQRREYNRYETGAYAEVPWIGILEEKDLRFPHISVKSKGQIAFTETAEKGFCDRQTVMRAGRYLTRFFPDLAKSVVRDWASKVTAHSVDLKIARSMVEIIGAYTYGSHPESCMSHPLSSYSSHVHPVSVYGDSDLGLAYFGTLDLDEPSKTKISARGLVWPDKKLYGRLYGATDTLKMLLEDAGYHDAYTTETHGTFNGAKIRAIPNRRGGWVMPYVDGFDSASLSTDRKWITLDNDGSICASNTCGYSGVNHDEDEDEDDNRSPCAECDDMIDNDDLVRVYSATYYSRLVCESCADHYYVECDTCGNRQHNDAILAGTDDQNHCTRCVRRNRSTCTVDGCGAQWHEATAFDSVRDSDVVDHICAEHESSHFYCETCEMALPRVTLPNGTDDTTLVTSCTPLPHFARHLCPQPSLEFQARGSVSNDSDSFAVPDCTCATCRTARERDAARATTPTVDDFTETNGWNAYTSARWQDGTRFILLNRITQQSVLIDADFTLQHYPTRDENGVVLYSGFTAEFLSRCDQVSCVDVRVALVPPSRIIADSNELPF